MLQRIFANLAIVPLRGLLSVQCPSMAFPSRFAKVGFRGAQNQALNAHQDLEEGGLVRSPSRSRPGAQQTQTHLARIVQVGMKANLTLTRRQELDTGRDGRVVGRGLHIKAKTAMGIGCVGRPGHEHANGIGPRFQDATKNTTRGANGQIQLIFNQFALQPQTTTIGRSRCCRRNGKVVTRRHKFVTKGHANRSQGLPIQRVGVLHSRCLGGWVGRPRGSFLVVHWVNDNGILHRLVVFQSLLFSSVPTTTTLSLQVFLGGRFPSSYNTTVVVILLLVLSFLVTRSSGIILVVVIIILTEINNGCGCCMRTNGVPDTRG